MSTSPNYFSTPALMAIAQLSVANTNLDGSTGTYVQLCAGVAAGRRISRVRLNHNIVGAPAAQKVTFFACTDGVAANKEFICDALLPSASAPSATVRSTYVEVPELVGMILSSTNNILYAACWVAQGVNVIIEYEDA
jgi:hypothetical protein